MTKKYKFHEVAEMFPAWKKEDFEKLKKSIKANGLRQAIILSCDGLIVDGRNRYKACLEAGVEPEFHTLPIDEDLVEYVMDANALRRHLTSSQRAIMFAKRKALVEKYRKEAEAIQAEAGDHGKAGGRGHKTLRTPVSEGFPPDREANTTRGKLGKQAGVGPAQMGRAMRVVNEAPDLIPQIESGDMKINEALEKIESRKDPGERCSAASSDPMDVAYREARNALNAVARKIDKVKQALEVLLKDMQIFKGKCKKSNRMDLHTKISEKLLRITGIGDYIRSRTCGVDLIAIGE